MYINQTSVVTLLNLHPDAYLHPEEARRAILRGEWPKPDAEGVRVEINKFGEPMYKTYRLWKLATIQRYFPIVPRDIDPEPLVE